MRVPEAPGLGGRLDKDKLALAFGLGLAGHAGRRVAEHRAALPLGIPCEEPAFGPIQPLWVPCGQGVPLAQAGKESIGLTGLT